MRMEYKKENDAFTTAVSKKMKIKENSLNR